MPPLSSKLDRKLRAAEESSDESENYEVTDRSSSESVLEFDAGDVVDSEDEDAAPGGSEDEEDMVCTAPETLESLCILYHANLLQSDASEDDNVQAQMSKVSFGALAKAQDALSKSTDRKRKRGEDSSKPQDDKLEALRERLRQIKAEKLASGEAKPSKKSKIAEKSKTGHREQDDNRGAENDSDSDAAPHARSSKHAPAVQSSKRMVSRKRQVVEVKKPVFRDPRFENIGGPQPDDNTLTKRYSFLNDYKQSEVADLKKAIKKSRNGDEKEQMRKQLESMESQMKAQQRKDELQAVKQQHKQKEKELIKDGKNPFYLKKCTLVSTLQPPCPTTDKQCSRAKEAGPDRPLPEHEVEAARQDHRTPSQEGDVEGAEEHAHGATHCMSLLLQVPAAEAGSCWRFTSAERKRDRQLTSTLSYLRYTLSSIRSAGELRDTTAPHWRWPNISHVLHTKPSSYNHSCG
jgi:ribosomal RNA-processing protein 36